LITSQLMPETWYEGLGDPAIAGAICGRLVQNANMLRLTGPSIREKKGLKTRLTRSMNLAAGRRGQ
jgi:DNA replication protein DnaC